MPWFLLALVGGAGALYYAKNEGVPAFDKWRVQLPTSDLSARDALSGLVMPLGGMITSDMGNGLYIVSMPHNVTFAAVPGASITRVSGVTVGGKKFSSALSPDDRFQGTDPDEARFPSGVTVPEGFQIAGMRWNGRRLR